jgi:hypothetical protein
MTVCYDPARHAPGDWHKQIKELRALCERAESLRKAADQLCTRLTAQLDASQAPGNAHRSR